jgi:myo-inositol 2-dehydrogenase/D-chiro-inositol 1-dehydrogenase
MRDSIVSVGIIGAGGMGGQHALNIFSCISGVKLVALCDIDTQRLDRLCALVGYPRQYDSPYALINDPQVEAIIVASPDKTHANYVLAGLEAGKPVFCEKPLAFDQEDAQRILRKEVSLGQRLVSVGFNRRFDPWHLAVREKCLSENLGKPLLWKGVHRNASAMYDTSGSFILNNSAGHDVDSARWLLGSEVSEVFVWGLKSRDELPETAQDLLVLNMGMENGTRSVAEVYVNASYGYEVSVEVVCQNGVVSSLPTEKAVIRRKNEKYVSVSDDFRGYFTESYVAEIASWISSIREKIPFCGADAWDGYSAIVVTQNAGVSLATGKVVKIVLGERPLLYDRKVL